jgi:tRNA (cmo5U34)-methyltransferase
VQEPSDARRLVSPAFPRAGSSAQLGRVHAFRARDVGNGLCCEPGAWTFGGDVSRVYDDHVRRSVPLYEELHELALSLGAHYVPAGGRAYDLGCATGVLTHRLQALAPEAEVTGVDIEREMIAVARRSELNTRFECADVRDFSFREHHFAVVAYTLQFLPFNDRRPLLDRLRRCLLPGGALLLAEKVVRRDPVFEAQCQAALHRFKLSQGFTEAQVQAKAQSLSGVLLPAFEDENIALLHAAGFGTVRHVLRHSSFDAWLALP